MKKRILSWFLCLCMLVGLFGAVPFAQAESYSGTAGTFSWSFDSETGVMTFSGSGTVNGAGAWNAYRGQIRSIVIEEGISAIAGGTFGGISTLTEVSFPSTVESIGSSAFGGCSALTDLVIPDSVVSIGSGAFSSCSALTSCTLGKGITAIADQVFVNCANLTTLNVKSSLTAIGSAAFANCAKLTAAPLSEGLVTIGANAFDGCAALSSVIIPASVESIGTHAFRGCTGVTSFRVEESNANFCSDASGVLYDKAKTTLIACVLPVSGNYEVPATVKTINAYAFSGCPGLTGILLSDGLESIGDSAFEFCTALTEVNLPDSVISIGAYVFRDCGSLESVSLSGGISTIPTSAFMNCSSIKTLVIPEGVVTLGNTVFSACSSLTSIALPESLTTIGSSAFYNCSALTSIAIGKNVGSISNAAFTGCNSMTAVTVAEENASYCSDDGILFDKEKTTLLYCPNSKEGAYTVPAGVTTIGNDSFRDCSKLTGVTLPEGLTTIGSNAFIRCTGLETVSIPDSVTSMSSYAFEYCSALLEVTVGSGLTAISRGAFRGCANLTAITLPAGITVIDQYGFNDCTNLDHILFTGTQAQWEEIDVKTNNSGLSGDVTVHFEATGEELYWDEHEGRQQLHCTLCESVVETPCNHFSTAIIPATEPTCTDSGLTAGEICTDCGEALTAQEVVPALGHSHGIPKDNGNGTHTATCACGDAITEAHSIVDGSCVCGFTQPYLNWTFNEETGTLTFSGNTTVDGSGQWNMYRGQIRSIVIEEGISAIAGGTFGGISTLTEVSIPSTVESIGSGAFGGCSALTEVTISEGVKRIESSVFSGCTSLTTITIPDSVETIGNALFTSCVNLTTVTLGEGITVISDQTFGGCANLTTVNVEGDITAIGSSAFAGCAKLTAVPLSEGLVTIGNSAFAGCAGLTSAHIPASVESIGTSAFGACTNIAAYSVAADNTHYCSDAAGVLYNIDKTVLIVCPTPFAGSYELPSSVKTIEDNAFAGCEKLTAIKLNDGLETIGGYAFQNCAALTEAEVPNSVRSVGSYAFADCSAMESATLPDSVDYMGTNVFRNCSALESVNIPAGITALPLMTFYGCSNLEEMAVPEGITQIDASVFANCDSLKSVTLPDSLITIGSTVFSDCSALESIHIPENVNSISNTAFNGCIGMTAVTVAAENETYCAEDGVLFSKDKTSLLLFPKGKAGAYVVPAGVTTLGYAAFKECGKVTEITLPESLTSISGDCFYRCVLLERVNIPDSVTTLPNFAFEYCTGLLEVKVGSGITAISRGAFRGCANLTAISLPAGITTISVYAFNDCGSLDHILFEGTQEQWNAIKVESNNSGLSGDVTVHFEATGEELSWEEHEGRQQLHCTLCETVVETPCNHFNTETNITVEASCTEDGSLNIVCSNCGKIMAEETLPALGHSEVIDAAVEAGCTNAGLTEGKHCDTCGEILIAQETLAALGHNYDIEVIAATCTQDGSATLICLGCNETLYLKVLPALGHSYDYINNGDNHKVVCKNRCEFADENGENCDHGCDYLLIEDHSFTEGVCICGALEVVDTVVDENLTFGAQLYLENDLTMAFRVKGSKLANYDVSTAYLVVEREAYESGATEAFVDTMTISEYTISADGRYVFSYPGIAAAQMNDAIRATLYIKDASGKEYVSPVLNTSVATYLDGLLSNSTSDTKLVTLIMDMVNYGAAAQVYFDRHADAPVNEAFESFKTYASYASADFTTILEDLSATNDAEGKSGKLNQGLDLGTRIGIQYKVTLPKGINAEDATLVITDKNGNELETIEVATGTVDSKGRYIVNFYGSTSKDMRRVVYATAYANGAAITGTYAYSISTYAWGIQENASAMDANLVSVTRAMMLYGDSASAYFG